MAYSTATITAVANECTFSPTGANGVVIVQNWTNATGTLAISRCVDGTNHQTLVNYTSQPTAVVRLDVGSGLIRVKPSAWTGGTVGVEISDA